MCCEDAAISSFGDANLNLYWEKLSQVCPNELPATCLSSSLSRTGASREKGSLPTFLLTIPFRIGRNSAKFGCCGLDCVAGPVHRRIRIRNPLQESKSLRNATRCGKVARVRNGFSGDNRVILTNYKSFPRLLKRT